MSTHPYQLTTGGIADLKSVWKYISIQSGSDAIADGFVMYLQHEMQKLADFPGMGRRRPEFCSHVRSFAVKEYVILYRRMVDHILILGVVHGKRQIEDLI